MRILASSDGKSLSARVRCSCDKHPVPVGCRFPNCSTPGRLQGMTPSYLCKDARQETLDSTALHGGLIWKAVKIWFKLASEELGS